MKQYLPVWYFLFYFILFHFFKKVMSCNSLKWCHCCHHKQSYSDRTSMHTLSSLKIPEICPVGSRGLGTLEASGTTLGHNQFRQRKIWGGGGVPQSWPRARALLSGWDRPTSCLPIPVQMLSLSPLIKPPSHPRRFYKWSQKSGWLHLGITGRTRQGVKKGCLSCCENHRVTW